MMPVLKLYSRYTRFPRQPKNITFSAQNIVNTTVTQDVRPPLGQVWRLTLAAVQMNTYTSPSAGSEAILRIKLNDRGTVSIITGDRIAQGDGQTAIQINASIGEASIGGLLLKNNRYLQLEGYSNSTSGTITCDMSAAVEIV